MLYAGPEQLPGCAQFSIMLHRLDRAATIAPPGFNRWLVPPASIAIHLCIGSVYAWSIFNPPLVKSLGVVASAADGPDLDCRQARSVGGLLAAGSDWRSLAETV